MVIMMKLNAIQEYLDKVYEKISENGCISYLITCSIKLAVCAADFTNNIILEEFLNLDYYAELN